jgi:hypothetical protein
MRRTRPTPSDQADGRPRAGCPNSRSSASVAKNHTAHLIAQPSDFIGIDGGAEALGKLEELLFLAVLNLCCDARCKVTFILRFISRLHNTVIHHVVHF